MGDFVTTELLFTQPRIYKAIGAIRDFIKKFDFVKYDEIWVDENIRGLDYFDHIDIYIPLTQDVNKKIGDYINVPHSKNDPDFINYHWRRIYDNKIYWQLCRGGRYLCEEDEDYIEKTRDEGTFDECICPQEFKEMCQGITTIFQKLANKRCSDVPPRKTYYF